MNKEIKITPKMEIVIKAVEGIGGAGFAKEVLNYLNSNEADRTELKTINAVNATLAYAAKAGILSSTKAALDEKMLTKYSVNDKTPEFNETVAE